jgi:hypothetical protein
LVTLETVQPDEDAFAVVANERILVSLVTDALLVTLEIVQPVEGVLAVMADERILVLLHVS